MKYFQIILLLLLMSCGNEKIVQLPEITDSDITEILDVSAAYLFYDETQTDSIELNRKTLISTTNWLVNVDKRLTLKQAIPKIILLQEKKRNAEVHKNEAAKNYYTCHDTSINNLGFIDFTDIFYTTYKNDEGTIEDDNTYLFNIIIKSTDSIILDSYTTPNIDSNKNTIIKELISKIEFIKSLNDTTHGSDNYTIKFNFNRNLTFQDYISIKALFRDFNIEKTRISNNEYIY